MAVELRPLTALLVLDAVLAVGTLGSLAVTETVGEPYDPTNEAIDLDGDDRALWLYTSQARSFDRWTLALNVVYGPPEETERLLLGGDWEETEDDEQDLGPGESGHAVDTDPVRWEQADGAQRYVYLVDGDRGAWLSETYQLHDGDYLGSRHHIRAYTPVEDGNWTAIQAHDEYWDWFSARHVVTSVESSQAHVESEFVDRSSTDVVRTHVDGEDRSDFDGWVTVVDLRDGGSGPAMLVLGLVAALGAITARTTGLRNVLSDVGVSQEVRAVLLGAGIVALYVAVRLSAIGLERLLDVPPKSIAVLLYPFLFVGLPVVTYLLGRQLARHWAFAGASLGFSTAILIDFTYLGVTAIPLDVLVHRGGLAVAIGFIAMGGSRTERRDPDRVSHVQLGVLLWIVATVQPLLRFVPLPL